VGRIATTRTWPRAPGLRKPAQTGAGRSWRLALLWQPALYLSMLFGFLLGRALPGLPGVPLGLAFLAALRASGVSLPGVLPVAALLAVGAWSVGAALPAVGFGAALSLVALGLLRIDRRAPSPLAAGAAAGAGATAAGALSLFRGWEYTPDITLLCFSAGVAAVLALVFCLGLHDAMTGRTVHMFRADAPFAVMALAGAALCGLYGLPSLFGLLEAWQVAAGFFVMAAAFAGGWTAGAGAGGVIVTASLAVQAGSLLATSASPLPAQFGYGLPYLVAGMLAGFFRDLGRWAVPIATGMGLLLCAYFRPDLDLQAVAVLVSGVVASGLLICLLPRRWLLTVPGAFFSTGASADGIQSPVPERVHSGQVAEQIRGLSRVLREIQRTFDQVAALAQDLDRTKESAGASERAAHQARERLCHGCSMFSRCWEQESDRTLGLLSGIWGSMERDGPLAVPEQLEQHCIYPKEMACTLTFLHELYRTHRYWERRFEEGRGVVGEYLRSMAGILERLGQEVADGKAGPARAEPAALRVKSGVARLGRKGSRLSGDTSAAEQVGDDRYLLLLSDGMGAGHSASVESRHCVGLLRQLLGAGFATDVAVQTVNSVLLLRSPEDTFATVDLALVDLVTGRAEFVKVGAPPAFLIRGSDITVIRAEGVPIGIINRVEVEPEVRIMRPGDLLVMVTDGIWEVARHETDKERWLIEHLRRTRLLDPEELAESVLARALELTDRQVADDMTVLVAAFAPVAGEPADSGIRRPLPTRWATAKTAPRRRAEEADPSA
jgi:stage II sporulation protein E